MMMTRLLVVVVAALLQLGGGICCSLLFIAASVVPITSVVVAVAAAAEASSASSASAYNVCNTKGGEGDSGGGSSGGDEGSCIINNTEGGDFEAKDGSTSTLDNTNVVDFGLSKYGESQKYTVDKRRNEAAPVQRPSKYLHSNTIVRIRKIEKYMSDVVMKEPRYASVKNDCRNQHELCTYWSMLGECDKNPNYMLLNCAPSCMSCDKLIYDERCPDSLGGLPVWTAGQNQLNTFFETITTQPYYIENYKPTILSRPDIESAETETNKKQQGIARAKKGRKPWVVTLDTFLTDEECDALIELGALRGYERSKDVDDTSKGKNVDGSYGSVQSDGRTSYTAWCLEECFANETAQRVLQKIVNLTHIPDTNSEYLQLLKYDEGQFYNEHHDFINHLVKRPQGPRLLTVFLYLNDVEEGGGTYFNNLDLLVPPKKGKALVWPSVLNHDPIKKDNLTHHEALPVIKGVKYGANAWIHLRDFKATFEQNCT